jgi:fucose permease
MTLLQTFMVVSLPVTGMCYAILGALKLPLAERLKMDEAKVGGLVSAFGFMVGPIILVCGFLADALGRKGVWFAGAVLVAASLFMLARTKKYSWAVCAVLLLSGGWAAMINVANVLMYLAYDNVFMATNLLDFFFGLGAFLTPALAVLLIRRLGFSTGVSLLGALAAIPALFSLAINMQSTPAAQPAGLSALASDPVLWLCALTMMFWAPIESCTAAWTTTFVNGQAPESEAPERSRRIAAWTLSGFWLCFMGARLLTALIFHSGDLPTDDAARTAAMVHTVHVARVTHIVLGALCIVTLLALVYSRKRAFTIALILLAGLFYGPFFPNLMAILLSHFPAELHGRAVGILFGCASVGWTVIPAIIGTVATKTTLQRGFLVAVADAIVLLAALSLIVACDSLGARIER